MILDRYVQLVNSLYCEPKEEVIMDWFLTKTQLSALLPASRIAASSEKTVKKKARNNGNNGVDIRKFFAAKERVILTTLLKFLIRSRNFFHVIYIVTVFNHKAKHICQNNAFFCLLSSNFCYFYFVFPCNCLSIISNKNQTINPTISTFPLYSGPKTHNIVIYVTKNKHWSEISSFSKLEFRGNKKKF